MTTQIEATLLSTNQVLDVVDDLVEHDLQGLLLSTSHLLTYCRMRFQDPSLTLKNELKAICESQEAAVRFQEMALKQFSGLYIAEIRFSNRDELSAHLNAKLNAFFKCDSQTTANPQTSIEIENAWKYRRCCAGFKSAWTSQVPVIEKHPYEMGV